VSPPGPDPTVTRFTFGNETADLNGQRLRLVVDGPAGLVRLLNALADAVGAPA
jgi:hypothetical protein